MTEKMLNMISARFPLTQVDIGEFAKLRAAGMNFSLRRFEADGLGVVSVMEAVGMAGLMKMDAVIINPVYRDMPLASCDGIAAAGRNTLILELYDTLLGSCDLSALDKVKQSAASLPAHDTGMHWYDSIKLPESFALRGGKKYAGDFERTALEFVSAYVSAAENAPGCDESEKRRLSKQYVEQLLLNGGPSTDVFKKALGEEKIAELFNTVLF